MGRIGVQETWVPGDGHNPSRHFVARGSARTFCGRPVGAHWEMGKELTMSRYLQALETLFTCQRCARAQVTILSRYELTRLRLAASKPLVESRDG